MGARDRAVAALGGGSREVTASVVSWRQVKSGVHRFHRALVAVREGGASQVHNLTVNPHGVVEELPEGLSSAARSAVISAVRTKHAAWKGGR